MLKPLEIVEIYNYGDFSEITKSYVKAGYVLINSNYTEYFDDTGDFIHQFTGIFMLKTLFN